MTIASTFAFAIVVASLPVGCLGDEPPPSEAHALSGRWKLVVPDQAVDVYAILDLKSEGGTLVAKPVAVWGLFSGPKVYVAGSTDALVVLITQPGGYGDIVFKGILPKPGTDDPIAGVFQFALDEVPAPMIASARLERTKDDQLPKPKKAPPAEGAGLLAELAKRNVATAEFRKEKYARLESQLAEDADKDVTPDALVRAKVWSAKRLFDAAIRAGRTEVANASNVRVDAFKREIERENRPEGKPLSLAPYRVPREKGEDRVVLLERFTSSWASGWLADALSFDAILSAYEPSEVIAIEYHTHSAAPDPLANPYAIDRHRIDQGRRAPFTLFNGRKMATDFVDQKYPRRKLNQYVGAIGSFLKGSKRAAIDLNVMRDGDALTISATSEAIGKSNGPLRLRFALIEDDVIYPSAEGREHHRHVVRATPGGADGVAMEGGKGRFEWVIKLDELRKSLNDYVADYPRSIQFTDGFRGGPPAIALKGLSVVAYVRDGEGEVLHAVMVNVPER